MSERLENLQLIAMEKKRKATRLSVSDLYLTKVARRGQMYNDGRSMGAIFKKSLGSPMWFETHKFKWSYNYSYTGALRDFIEGGVTYPAGTFDDWWQNRYSVELSMSYPEYGLSFNELGRRTTQLFWYKVKSKLGLL